MNRIVFINLIILIGIFSCHQEKQEEILSVIDSVKNEYAPDKRTAVFNIEAIGSNPILLKGETNLPEAKDQLLSSAVSLGIKIKDAVTVLPDEDLGELKYALINVSVANLRGQPKHSAELVTQALLGTPVKLLKEEKGWYLMQTPDKYIAWSNSGSITRLAQDQLEKWKEATKIIYLDSYGFSLDPTSGKRVSDLVAGNILILKNENKETWEVEYPNGRAALIKKSEAQEFHTWKNELAVSESSISATAKDLMGVPYLWGGTSTKGVDCSGFTKTVYLLQGFVIPRDASQQVHIGTLVDTDKDFTKLKVGDLLFFGRRNEDLTERVVHVGMWLGNNQFIHASSDVHINSMDSLDDNYDRYNYDRYLRAKRIIGKATEFEEAVSQLF